MSQIYASYLANFLENEEVHELLLGILRDPLPSDWQKLWVLAALSRVETSSDAAVKVAWDLVGAKGHDALRAVAAIHVGQFGTHTRRKALVSIYGSVSNYIQAAIYYSSRGWPGVERSNAKASWSGHGHLHSLIATAMGNK